MKRVACVGILVADVIVEPVNEYPGAGELTHVNSITLHNGGNAMTAAINLTKLGVPASMVGKVGNDMFGAYLKGILEKDGIDTRGLSVDEKVQTSASVVLIAPSGERSFLHCVGANAVFSIDDIDFKVIEECDLVFVTGTYLLKSFDGDETVAFLKKCKENGIHTAVDTAGCVPFEYFERIIPYTDLFLYDVKCMDADRHKKYTGVDNGLILENLKKILRAKVPVWVRIPVVPTVNDDLRQMQEIYDFLIENGMPEKIELLPYHSMGEHKYAALGKKVQSFCTPPKEKMELLKSVFTK